MKRALILGECSRVIARAFETRGYQAWSVDIKPAEQGQFHIQGDWDAYFLEYPWQLRSFDIVFWHPECTKLSVSGNWVYAAGKPRHQERLDALEYTRRRWNILKQYCRKAVLENPRGVLKSVLGPYTCSVQPYEFGDDASKATDLWTWDRDALCQELKPLLKSPEKRLAGRIVTHNGKQVERWSNQTDSGQNRLGPSETRAAERAETYPGIAGAFAEQWG